MSPAFECLALRLRTRQGCPLAVGGICRAGTASYWRERLRELEGLSLGDGDIVSIDRALAEALEALEEESLLVAGASLRVEGLVLPVGVRTGGVIGSPRRPIASAEGLREALPEGFAQQALPGGPGLAAYGPEEAAARALEAILARCPPVPPGPELMACLAAEGLRTGLLVFDGTGPQAPGCLLAFGEGRWEEIRLREPPCP